MEFGYIMTIRRPNGKVKGVVHGSLKLLHRPLIGERVAIEEYNILAVVTGVVHYSDKSRLELETTTLS